MIFKSIFNEVSGTWVAVAENVKAKGKKSGSTKAAAVTTALILGGLGFANGAMAACSSTLAAPSTYVCSGSDTATQIITTNGATVTTAGGYTNNSAGNAIYIGATGPISFTDTNTSNITGSATGIYMVNTGSGDTTVSTTGDVKGNGVWGVYTLNNATSAATTVNVATATGLADAINAQHYGTGDLKITATGLLTSTAESGIEAYNYIGSGKTVINVADIKAGGYGVYFDSGTSTAGTSITTGNITSGADGIRAFDSGATGDFSVTTGDVTAASGYGIAAHKDAGTGNTTITANNITSTANGIYSDSATGTGGISVTANNITSSAEHGMLIYKSGTGDLNVKTTGAVKGAYTGMRLYNDGAGGDIIVNATGDVTGDREWGIYAENNSAGKGITVNATNLTGQLDGIHTTQNGTGDVNITTTGTVTGTVEQGMDIYSFGSGATTIKASGDVIGNQWGIYVDDLATGKDISISATNVTANSLYDGIRAWHRGSGDLTIVTTGMVKGATEDGIDAKNLGTSAANLVISANGATGAMNGIRARNDGTGSTTVTVNGVVTGGSGGIEDGAGSVTGEEITAGINTYDIDSTSGNNITTIALNSGAVVSAATGIAIRNDEGDSTTDVNSGAAVIGKVILNAGNDNLNINGTADISGVTLLDGGNQARSVDLLGSTTHTNKLTFNTTTQSIAGSTMVDWQTVTLDGSNVTFKTDAALVTGVGTNSDGSLQGLVLKNASTLTSPIALAVTGDVNIDATSTLSHALGGSITGDVTNAGMIYWQNLGQVLTINGNYTGAAGNISLGTDLGNDSSVTDKLVITGDSSGTTAVTVRPEGTSAGAQTNVGIDVIDVTGTSGATFTLAAPVQAGVYEYVLKKGGNGGIANNWYLVSALCEITDTCITPTTPTTSTPVDSAGNVIPIYRPGVANYVVAQTANADLGYLALDTLHQRMGEQRGVSTAKPQTWIRAIAGYTSNSGKTRFEYDQTSVGFQIGRDLLQTTASNGTQQHAGVTTQYLRGNVDTRDRVRPLVGLSENTGHLQTTAYGLGGYYTRMTNQGTYLDLVTQINRLDNQFVDSYGTSSKQKGWQAGLSAEVGTPFGQIKGWQFEHQAQLTYLYGRYGDFSDKLSNIGSLNTHNLRARLGLRVHKQTNPDSAKSAQYYGIVNLHQDLISPKSIQLTSLNGSNTVGVSEKYDRTTWELGAGVQHPLGKDTYFYGDARYEQSFNDRKHGGKITFGIKSSF